MFDFIRDHQLNIMLALSGACGICAFFVCVSRNLSGRKKRSLLLIELCAMALLLFDRAALIYDGVETSEGFYGVRISNFFLFFFTIAVVYFFNLYLTCVFIENKDILVVPKRLKIVEILAYAGEVLVIVSQFTGLYYTFDSHNTYVRSSWFLLSYVVPFLIPIIQLSFVVHYFKKIHKGVRMSLLLFPLVPIAASIIQVFTYGIVLTDMMIAFVSIILYVFALLDVNNTLEESRRGEVLMLKNEESAITNLFEQTVTAFVNAIDIKDVNKRGHAVRVAGYALKIAQIVGKTEAECQEAYLSALLHDVGKISLPDRVITSTEKLSKEDRKIYDTHVTKGRDILSYITEFPYLKDAAAFHHEWYDGSGFPEGLSGKNIPDLARLVAVADVYDGMSSIRHDREPMPQSVIREEFVKGSGKRYDPVYARAVLKMIDEDTDYKLREHHEEEREELEDELICEEYRSKITKGILITDEVSRVEFSCESTLSDSDTGFSQPAIILFDAIDGRIHRTERSIGINRYLEYGEMWFDDHTICTAARNVKSKTYTHETEPGKYMVEMGKIRDHVRLRLYGEGLMTETIVALPDSASKAYISLTGENCHIKGINTDPTGVILKEWDIPRIAGEVSYIDRMIGDVPNIQVDGYCSAATEGMSIRDGMEIVFHTMALPTANLVWHCPFLVFFKSDNHKMFGENYEELVIVRLDGESIATAGSARSTTEMRKNENFKNWDVFKKLNKKGFECKVTLKRLHNRIIMNTENAGIAVKTTIYLEDKTEDIQVAITGDQCALTDIRFIA